MENESKLDLILKKITETDQKLADLEKNSRADMSTLKTAMDSWRPTMEKKMGDLASAVGGIQQQLDQIRKTAKPELGANQHGQFGARDATLPWEEVFGDVTPTPPPANGNNLFPSTSPAPYFHDTSMRNAMSGCTITANGSLPPMPCPQFDGDNPQMWRENCEAYFDTYGVNPSHWVRITTLNFIGNAPFWLQSVRSQLIGVTWSELCDKVCAKFTRDRHQQLIRQYIHIKQTGSVTDYVEKFDSIMHQMLAYDSELKPVYFVTKFVEGLRDAIRTVIMVQRPQDLDTACALALLQEEAMARVRQFGSPRTEFTSNQRPSYKSAVPMPLPTPPVKPVQIDDKMISDPAKTVLRNDGISALRSYRRSKGLCFTCGERWSRDHKCSPTIQLHVMEELLEALQVNEDPCGDDIVAEAENSLMAISSHAVAGVESPRSIRLRGWIQGVELLMLLDSGSTHSFLGEHISSRLQGLRNLDQPVQIKVADGGLLLCSMEIPNCDWWMQGNHYRTNFKVLQLGGYDAILVMDWLEKFSPMHIDWSQKWLEFVKAGEVVRIQGILPQTDQCSIICPIQVKGLLRSESVMHLIHLQKAEQPIDSATPSIIQQVLSQFQEVFQEPSGLPPKRNCDHKIPLLEGARPVNLRPYRHTPVLKDEIERQVAEMLHSGVIQTSNSAFSSPALLVKKKDGTWRLCIDYRHLNAITIKGKYPLPVIDELLDELSGAVYFSKLDLRAGYHQIRLQPGEEHKTAFQTHSGHYEYRVMSFGLTGARATFQKAMNDTLASVLRKFALVFFDDILVYSPTLESHAQHLQQILQLLLDHQWKVKLSKCSFAQKQLSYLGHIIGEQGVSTDPSKIADVVNWKTPTIVKKLRGFLGLAGYYRKFVKNFGVINKPLTQLLRKDTPFVWTSATESAFQTLKSALVSALVLALPNFSKTFTIETDAIDTGIGAVLSQEGHPVAFVSRALGPKTRGLSTYEKEYLAILLAVDQWRF